MKKLILLLFLVSIKGQPIIAQQHHKGAVHKTTTVKPAVKVVLPADTALVAKALAGDATAQAEIGRAYFYGEKGVKENYPEAVKWYQKSVGQGSAYGKYGLGICYDKGKGVTENFTKANQLYNEAFVDFTKMAKVITVKIIVNFYSFNYISTIEFIFFLTSLSLRAFFIFKSSISST